MMDHKKKRLRNLINNIWIKCLAVKIGQNRLTDMHFILLLYIMMVTSKSKDKCMKKLINLNICHPNNRKRDLNFQKDNNNNN